MKFCPVNSSFASVWSETGLSICFFETVANATVCGYIITFGLIQSSVYAIYSKLASDSICKNTSSGLSSKLQLILTGLIPMLEMLRLILQSNLIGPQEALGYMISVVSLSFLTCILSVPLIGLERNCMLIDGPKCFQKNRHGNILLIFWTLMAVKENLYFLTLSADSSWFHLNSISDSVELAIFCCRYIATILLFVLGFLAPGIPRCVHSKSDLSSKEILLKKHSRINRSPWRNIGEKIKLLGPFLWPKKEVWLQIRVMVYFVCVAAERVINLYVPIYSKMIVDSITPDATGSKMEYRWDLVVIYVVFRLMQGSGSRLGILGNVKNFLWIRVQQYTEREVQVEFFAHLQSLSVRWHLQRKTGEVLRAVDRGTESINTLLNYVLFNILPTLADFVIAVVYFTATFNAWFGFIVVLTVFIFIVATISLTEWRTKFRRLMNQADNEQRAQAVDSLLNFETVKYYAAEKYEVKRYSEVIKKYQVEEWKLNVAIIIFNMAQNFIINGGLLAGSLLCISMVVDQELTVGDYVLFASYIMQLYAPLASFGSYYRTLQKSLIDMENLFDIFRSQPEIRDAKNAKSLIITKGQIEFDDVSFQYGEDKRQNLQGISFVASPGKTVALVGLSGSGKSTILRLLFRFYDVTEGRILVDGQDIRDVTQESLRKCLGIVPQDAVLYNSTIEYNIRYGRIDATREEVIEAAKCAEIHDTIMSLKDGYDTQVGERGLKLSGGEKQRVAIARTLLKSPTFVLLDEATSALDSHTEKSIQNTLDRVLANHTTISIAHRLSTIIHADEILVLKDGVIVERGIHEHLLLLNGLYASLWEEQTRE